MAQEKYIFTLEMKVRDYEIDSEGIVYSAREQIVGIIGTIVTRHLYAVDAEI